MTSLRLLAVLNVLFKDACARQAARARPDGPLTHFASPRGEKCRLVKSIKAVIRVSCLVFRENQWVRAWFAPDEMSGKAVARENGKSCVSCFVKTFGSGSGSLQTKCLKAGEPYACARLFPSARLAPRPDGLSGSSPCEAARDSGWAAFCILGADSFSDCQTVVLDIRIFPLWLRFRAWRKVGES